jgi:MFS family permease
MMHVLSHPLLIDQQTLPAKRRANLALATITVSYDPAGGDGLEALAPRYMADSVPLKSLLVPTVVIPIANYAMLAFLDISLRALFPLIFSTPIYLGGLGFAPASIGSWLALFGIVDGVFQALFFAKMVDWLGPKRLFCVSVSCFAPVMAMFPIISWLASARGMVDHAITFTLLGQLVLIVLWDMSFGECFNKSVSLLQVTHLITGTIFLFITASAPSQNVLGAINGLGQTSAAMARAFGPALATSLFAFSKEHNILNGNAIYVIFIILAGGLRWLASQLPDKLHDRGELKKPAPPSRCLT